MVFTMEKISEAQAIEIREEAENEKDSADDPPHHYPLRPQYLGQLIFISGGPGVGKSSTARRMMEKEGFVYYEGDCFMEFKNPFLPPGDNTAEEAGLEANNLKDVPKERLEVVMESGKEWEKAENGEEYSLEEVYSLMCEDVKKQRTRIGGDWVVVHAVPTRKLRDMIKDKLGPGVVFVVLDMDETYQRERLFPRIETLGMDLTESFMKIKYEPAGDKEENSIDLKITRGME